MKLRMHVINAVFKRNFLSYFSGVIGYLVIIVFVVAGALAAFQPQFFANNLDNLDQLNIWFPRLLLFLVPAITMGVWSDERKLGTDELLFTLPASDLEILLGKYAAVMGIYLVALFFSLSHVLMLFWLGSPDKGLLFATYVGYAVAGSALLSAGMLGSVLTPSATVAYVLGLILCAIPVYVDMSTAVVPAFVDRLIPFSRLLQGLSVGEQFRDFSMGMIPLGGLLYFLSLTVLFLYLNLVFISRRHWSGGPHQTPMWLHYAIRAAALAAILVSVNVAGAGANRRLDLTSEKLYSLSGTTKDVLGKVKPDRPVLIQAFISPEVPRDLVSTRSTLIGLLRQYDQEAGGRVRIRIVNTEKFTDTAEEAVRYGILSQEVQSDRAGRIVRDDVYLGVVVTSVDEQVVIPFFERGMPVEYELTRSIHTVSESKRKTVGILRTDAQIAGGFDMQTFTPTPEWRVSQELRKQYDIKQVSPEELGRTDVDVLVAVMPSSLTDPEVIQFIDYIDRGKPTLIVDDPFPIIAVRFSGQAGLVPRSPKPRPGGMGGMFNQGGPQPEKADKGNATKLCKALGIQWNSGQTVWDRYDPHPEFRQMLDANQLANVVYVAKTSGAKQAFNPDSRITRGLQEIMLFYPRLDSRPRGASKMKFEPLLRVEPRVGDARIRKNMSKMISGGPILVIPDDQEGTRDEKPRDDRRPHYRPGPCRVDGKSAGSINNVVYVADMDMISNVLFMIRDMEWQGLKLDNIAFALNAVDELAGEESLLSLRGRQPTHRTLTRIEASTNEFKKQEVDESAKAAKRPKRRLPMPTINSKPK